MASKELLKKKEVIDEINRHKWIESEKVGYDIGFNKAAEDWVLRYADQWERTDQNRGVTKVVKAKKAKNDKR